MKGITHVLSIVDLPVKRYPEICVYKQIEVEDIPKTNLMPYFPETDEFIDNVLKQKNARLLVHCRAGVSRSASLIISYLITKRGLSYNEAFRVVKN